VVGIDYVGMCIDCDYVITDNVDIALELMKKYEANKLILPTVIRNRIIGRYEFAAEICPGSIVFELKQFGHLDISIHPPFINIDDIVVTAVHMALFMKPSNINLYGVDYRLINYKSHAAKIGYYEDGSMLADSETTTNKFRFSEYALHKIGDIAVIAGIPIMRINHL